MKVELEIITDRLPTEADGDGTVLKYFTHMKEWWPVPPTEVKPGDIWMRQPPPPKPPIDMSLAASISRFTGWLENAIFDEPLGSDCIAVRDAARKWDEAEKLKKSPCYDESTGTYYSDVSKKGGPYDHLSKKFRKDLNTQASKFFGGNDPDGVGEGWRLLKEGEIRESGYEYRSKNSRDEWKKGDCYGVIVTMHDVMAYEYRRRIEAE